MKTSNKLMLGFFLLVIVVITVGLIFLKTELKKASSIGLNNNQLTIELVKQA